MKGRGDLMTNDQTLIYTSPENHSIAPHKKWQTPEVKDADVDAITAGTGTSGIEGTPFLKPGS